MPRGVSPLNVFGAMPNELRIQIARGTGAGPTPAAAFDAALMDAGVANYNLLCLSSVIPPRAQLLRGRHLTPAHQYGQRLYVVLSQMSEERPGHQAAAGLGWVQDEVSGCGLFVELHHADRARLEHDLHVTLDAMTRQRTVDFGPVHTEIAQRECERQPVCALVVAVYACEPW